MKTAAKVFTIISMVFTFWLIFPLVLGAIALSKLENPTTKDNMLVWGIVTLVFVSLLGGIFFLLYNEQYFADKKEVYVESPSPAESSNAHDKLKELKSLYDEGIITEEEYNTKREQYLKEL